MCVTDMFDCLCIQRETKHHDKREGGILYGCPGAIGGAVANLDDKRFRNGLSPVPILGKAPVPTQGRDDGGPYVHTLDGGPWKLHVACSHMP